jgi:hypothetical protein
MGILLHSESTELSTAYNAKHYVHTQIRSATELNRLRARANNTTLTTPMATATTPHAHATSSHLTLPSTASTLAGGAEPDPGESKRIEALDMFGAAGSSYPALYNRGLVFYALGDL